MLALCWPACAPHVGREQSALLAHAHTNVLPHLGGTATQARAWWFVDTTNLAEPTEQGELASKTGRTE